MFCCWVISQNKRKTGRVLQTYWYLQSFVMKILPHFGTRSQRKEPYIYIYYCILYIWLCIYIYYTVLCVDIYIVYIYNYIYIYTVYIYTAYIYISSFVKSLHHFPAWFNCSSSSTKPGTSPGSHGDHPIRWRPFLSDSHGNMWESMGISMVNINVYING
jgi:hypothetical protein